MQNPKISDDKTFKSLTILIGINYIVTRKKVQFCSIICWNLKRR